MRNPQRNLIRPAATQISPPEICARKLCPPKICVETNFRGVKFAPRQISTPPKLVFGGILTPDNFSRHKFWGSKFARTNLGGSKLVRTNFGGSKFVRTFWGGSKFMRALAGRASTLCAKSPCANQTCTLAPRHSIVQSKQGKSPAKMSVCRANRETHGTGTFSVDCANIGNNIYVAVCCNSSHAIGF